MPSRAFVAATLVVAVSTSAAAQTAEPAPPPTPTRTPFTAGYKNGFTLRSETGDFVLKLSGYAQADGRFLCRR